MVVDSRKKRDGKFIERIGFYDPKPKELKYKVDEERAIYWLGQGAIPSPTVKSLLKRAGILKKIHEMKYSKKVSNRKSDITAEENIEIRESAEKSVNKTNAGGAE